MDNRVDIRKYVTATTVRAIVIRGLVFRTLPWSGYRSRAEEKNRNRKYRPSARASNACVRTGSTGFPKTYSGMKTRKSQDAQEQRTAPRRASRQENRP